MEPSMSGEMPKNDPRQATHWKNSKQTDEPWKGPVEKEQKPGGLPPDLEKMARNQYALGPGQLWNPLIVCAVMLLSPFFQQVEGY
jgi:hypothetical protein